SRCPTTCQSGPAAAGRLFSVHVRPILHSGDIAMPDLQDTLRRLAERFVARDIMTLQERLVAASDQEEAMQILKSNPRYDVVPIRQGDRLVSFLERGTSKPRTIQIQHVVGAETSI